MGVEEEAKKHLDIEERVTQLEKDIKSLKRKLNKLTKQVNEQVAISGFQEQLSAFDKRITKIEDSSLKILRSLAIRDVDELKSIIEGYIKLDSKKHPQAYRDIHEFLLTKSAAATQEIKHSSSPSSVVDKFDTDCESYCKARGFNPFEE
jgi:predicted  nucleic acid-binding Zn-ribbon protein